MATLVNWNSGLPTMQGTAGTASMGSGSGFPSNWLEYDRTGASAYYAEWTFTPVSTLAARFYYRTPSAWGGSSCSISDMLDGSAVGARLSLAGTGSPGQLRLVAKGGTQVASTTGNTLAVDTVYRIEYQVDLPNESARAAVFELGHDSPLWDSGWQWADIGTTDRDSFTLGYRQGSSPNLGVEEYSHLLVSDDVSAWLGRHSGDTLAPPPDELFSWKTGSLPEMSEGGTATVDTQGTFPLSFIELEHDATQPLQAEFEFASVAEASMQAYFRTPEEWPEAAFALMSFRDNSSPSLRITISGSGQPGKVRLGNPQGGTLAESQNQLMQPSTWYRCQLQADAGGGRGRGRIFRLGRTEPSWDSGWVPWANQPATVNNAVIGKTLTPNPLVGPFAIAFMEGFADLDTIPRGVGDDPPPVMEAFSVWTGSSLQAASAVHIWDGDNLIPVEDAFLR